jgi:hypothetical protein
MATCLTCNKEFEIRPWFKQYCSSDCKGAINAGMPAWNKGLKMTDEQKSKMNLEGFKLGWGWNKGIPNEIARQRMIINNPNKDGKVNNSRPKKLIEDEFILYKRECKKATYRSWYKMKKEGLIPENTGKRKDQFQLDHIIPFKQGFDLKIDPSIIGGMKNLRYILGEDNRKKWDSYQPINVVTSIIGD